MRGLKRLEIATLRQGAPKGRKVLHVWDRAGIDFRQWYKWKQGSGIYLLSRCKTNMALLPCGKLPFDGADAINAGVLRDELVGTATSGNRQHRVQCELHLVNPVHDGTGRHQWDDAAAHHLP